MKKPLILVVDDDERFRTAISHMVVSLGFGCDSASNGIEALACVERRVPDLVLTDVVMPKMDGWALIKRLRSQARTALTPVIFLTALRSDEDRLRGFKLGADDYLAKPFKLEELKYRIKNALGRAEKARDSLESESGVRGSLAEIGLSSLLVMLEMERKTGVLTLTRKPSTAQLYLKNGRVLQARLDPRKDLKDAACVLHLLTWIEGSFSFSAEKIDVADQVNASISKLLVEAARLVDEGP